MSNLINDQLKEQYYEEAMDYYWNEGYRGELLDELCTQDVNYRLENDNE